MKRKAFTMKLKKGFEAEYKIRHDKVWPEVQAALQKAGISDYSIFLDKKTLTLFAVQKLTGDNTTADLPHHPAIRKWWDYMADIMECHPDHAPIEVELLEVFHMD
ncbi:MAG: L-rhamnose mutarotase [Sedimentisphaerales bacterium]|nr:L-rhamnose mutarotase [Sedimentisphaerales bacterium]